ERCQSQALRCSRSVHRARGHPDPAPPVHAYRSGLRLGGARPARTPAAGTGASRAGQPRIADRITFRRKGRARGAVGFSSTRKPLCYNRVMREPEVKEMVQPQVFEGTADEIAEQLRRSKLAGRLRAVVMPEEI